MEILKINLFGRFFAVAHDQGGIWEVMENDRLGRSIRDSVEEPHVWAGIRSMTGLAWASGPCA